MTSEEFRRLGREVVDRVADYLETIESRSVRATVDPGAIRAQLPAQAPEDPEPFDAAMADLDAILMPGLTHWQHPMFFGYFPANTSGPAILGELLSAGLGVQGMLWQTSPACTELETHVLDWLVPALGLPERFLSTGTGGGVIQDTASSATLCALLAARERATDGAAAEHGATARLVVYCSDEAHSSVEKAVVIAGLGRDNLRRIPCDGASAMRPDALAEAMRDDLAEGLCPCFVVATVGTTAAHGIDPVPAIAELCAEHGAWLHVDAAHAGAAALCPEFRHLHAGVERADSYCFNPHKWMLTNFDCDCFWVADRAALLRALSILPEYLRNAASDSGAVIDYRDWQVPLGRRFRALKLWLVLRWYGLSGLRAHLRAGVAQARSFAARVAASPELELLRDPPLSLVVFAHRAGDEVSRRMLERLNDSGAIFLSHAAIDGRYALRLALGGTQTRDEHVDRAFALVEQAARDAG